MVIMGLENKGIVSTTNIVVIKKEIIIFKFYY
jgi:hypothetical protein